MSDYKFSVFSEYGSPDLLFAESDDDILEFARGKWVPLSDAVDFFESEVISEEEAMKISSGVMPSVIKYSVFSEFGSPDALFAESGEDILEFVRGKWVPLSDAVDFVKSTTISKEEAMSITSGVMPTVKEDIDQRLDYLLKTKKAKQVEREKVEKYKLSESAKRKFLPKVTE